MAILGVNYRDGALSVAADRLRREAAERAPGDGPSVVLIHGYKYDPADPRRSPHGLLYGPADPLCRLSRRVRSWPAGLGVTPGGPDGLCLGYGWTARRSWLRTLLTEGRNGFAAAYDEAGRAGAGLVAALDALAAARSAPVDVLAHSLGARVALSALRAAAEAGQADLITRLGRWVLLGPAEFSGQARAALDACARIGATPPEIYCFSARHNARYDALFSLFAPLSARDGVPLGLEGLGAARPRWLDIAFDHPETPGRLAARGVRLAAHPEGRACHWGFYLREGAMELHRAILRRAPGFAVADLRAARLPAPAARRNATSPMPDVAEPAAA